MEFNEQEIANRLKTFQVKVVRIDEPFDLGSKRGRGVDILTSIVGKRLVLACTDERPVQKVIDIKTGKDMDAKQLAFIHTGGAALGLVDAIRNVRVTIRREEILAVLEENGIIVANHVDTHAEAGLLTGCGYGGLRALPESGSIFDRPPVDLHERMSAFEQMGAVRVVLDGEHTAEGLVINPHTDKVLDPNAPQAKNSFFSLDMGIYKAILHQIEGSMRFGEEVMREMLVKLVRDTLAAVFILSNAQINEAVYIERADEHDSFYSGVLHEGLGELKERVGPVLHVLEQRMK